MQTIAATATTVIPSTELPSAYLVGASADLADHDAAWEAIRIAARGEDPAAEIGIPLGDVRFRAAGTTYRVRAG